VAAIALAIGALGFALSLETGQRFLQWKVARRQAEAAALAGVMALDGTDEGRQHAREAAGMMAGATENQVRIAFAPEGDSLRLTLLKGTAVSAAAIQRESSPDADTDTTFAMAAPKAEAADFGLAHGVVYKVSGNEAATLQPGRIVPVQVHSGFPKEIPLTWIAGRVIKSEAGVVEMEYLGGYLRGARHAAAKPYGYYEVALGDRTAPAEVKTSVEVKR